MKWINRQTFTCFALGAASMYLLDPALGRRRRKRLGDKAVGAWHDADECVRKTADYSRNRAAGFVARARAAFAEDDADDVVLCQRVRSAMGRVVSHPHAIQVNARDGLVTLAGRVLALEHDELLRTVARVRGVREVDSRLDVYARAGREPDLQGGLRRTRARRGMARDHWAPSTRVLGTAGGAVLALLGLTRGGPALPALTLPGGLLLLRSLTDLSARRMSGVGAGPDAIHVQKTITIHAPVDEVFGFFSNYQNFPHFMSNVHEVRAHEEGHSHWVVAGPMGVEVSWDAVLTDYVPHERIAWRSIEGAAVENAGVMRFQAERGGTRVDIKLSYNPPGGAIGHVIARLFGADPKSEMDADLVRVKTMLETGHAARDAAHPAEGHVAPPPTKPVMAVPDPAAVAPAGR